MTPKILLSLLCAACLALPAQAATPKPAGAVAPAVLHAAPERVTTVEGVTEYRLANGLRVLLAPDASKPTTTLNVTYLVGSRHEGYGETGMAHLLEHLVFKGTPSLPEGALVAGLKNRGMQYNGSTFYDRTNYFETFASGDDNLDWALKMEADRMVNSFIAKKDLDSEMTVVRNEMERGENSPVSVLFKQVTGLAFQWHNYGKNTIGARADVENVIIERLQAFYRKYYQPDNAVLILSGKFEPTDALARIQRSFGAIPKPTRVLNPTWTREPTQEGERTATIRRAGDMQAMMAIYHVPNGAHPDVAALEVLGEVLDSTPSGRLYEALVETRKATSVGAGALQLAEPGYFIVQAFLDKKGSLDEVRRIAFETIDGLRDKPVDVAELQRAKLKFANAFEQLLANPQALAIRLSEYVAQGDWRLLFLNRDQIEAVSAADVQRVAANYLKPSNRSVGMFIPDDKADRTQMPAEAKPAELLAGYTGRKAVASGEAFDPSPANIDARTITFALDDGARIALLAKKTRGETVSGRIVMRFGDEKSLFDKNEQIDMMAAMLDRGAAGLSHAAIDERLDALNSRLTIDTWHNTLIIGFESRRDKLGDFLPLLADVLRRPDFHASELETLKAQAVAALEASSREPASVAIREAGRYDNPYPKGDLRYTPTVAEAIASLRGITAADLRRLHADFLGIQDAQIALVGDFDADAVRGQLGKLFGDWRAKKPSAELPLPYRPAKPAVLKFETPDKANAQLVGGTTLPVGESSPDMPALLLANRILGESGLSSRLGDRIRQKEGLSYGVGSFLSLREKQDSGELAIVASYAPENLDRLMTALREELTRFATQGVSASELEDARKGMLQQMSIARSNDGSLARTLSTNLWVGRDMKWQANLERRLQAITVDELNAVIRKYFDPEHFAFIQAGDFARVAAKK